MKTTCPDYTLCYRGLKNITRFAMNSDKNVKKGGRPKLEKGKRSIRKELLLNEEENKKLQESASKLGIKTSEYLRMKVFKEDELILNRSNFTLEEKVLIRKLSGMSNNLNQMTKALWKYSNKSLILKIESTLTAINKLLDKKS